MLNLNWRDLQEQNGEWEQSPRFRFASFLCYCDCQEDAKAKETLSIFLKIAKVDDGQLQSNQSRL